MKEQELFEAYGSGFIDGITNNSQTKENEGHARNEYLIGMQDGKDVLSHKLNFALWKDDYNRRNK